MKSMSRTHVLALALSLVLVVVSDPPTAIAQNGAGGTATRNPPVAGARVPRSNDLWQSASTSRDLTTFASAVRTAGLSGSLSENGPYTVFAPNDTAFDALPTGTLDNLMKSENRQELAGILRYHIVPGRMTAAYLANAIAQGDGKATLATLDNQPLTVTQDHGQFTITDSHGNVAHVNVANIHQTNGVMYVIDKVLLPPLQADNALP